MLSLHSHPEKLIQYCSPETLARLIVAQMNLRDIREELSQIITEASNDDDSLLPATVPVRECTRPVAA